MIQGIRAATFAPQNISLVLEEYDESHTSEISKPLLIIPPLLSYHPPSSPWRSMSLRDGFSSPIWRLGRPIVTPSRPVRQKIVSMRLETMTDGEAREMPLC